jgi:hypothetical protein
MNTRKVVNYAMIVLGFAAAAVGILGTLAMMVAR